MHLLFPAPVLADVVQAQASQDGALQVQASRVHAHTTMMSFVDPQGTYVIIGKPNRGGDPVGARGAVVSAGDS